VSSVRRPSLSAAFPPQTAFRLDALPMSPVLVGEPQSGTIVNRAGLKRASGMAVGYTKWLVDQSTPRGPADTPAVETAGGQLDPGPTLAFAIFLKAVEAER
jgi:hypothetical protein